MTQVVDILTAAFRETNIVAPAQSQNPTETAEALTRLQALVLSSLGNEVGYIMEDWNMTATVVTRPSGVPLNAAQFAAYTVRPNSRLIFNLAAPKTILLDPQPQDGQRFSVVDANNAFVTSNLTINPNGRKINGATANLVLSTAGDAKQWLYRSDIGDWVLIDPLTAVSEMPFPADFDDYFVISLAKRINPRYGQSLKQESQDRLVEQRLQFIARYTQSRLRSVPSPNQSNPARPEGN